MSQSPSLRRQGSFSRGPRRDVPGSMGPPPLPSGLVAAYSIDERRGFSPAQERGWPAPMQDPERPQLRSPSHSRRPPFPTSAGAPGLQHQKLQQSLGIAQRPPGPGHSFPLSSVARLPSLQRSPSLVRQRPPLVSAPPLDSCPAPSYHSLNLNGRAAGSARDEERELAARNAGRPTNDLGGRIGLMGPPSSPTKYSRSSEYDFGPPRSATVGASFTRSTPRQPPPFFDSPVLGGASIPPLSPPSFGSLSLGPKRSRSISRSRQPRPQAPVVNPVERDLGMQYHLGSGRDPNSRMPTLGSFDDGLRRTGKLPAMQTSATWDDSATAGRSNEWSSLNERGRFGQARGGR